VRVGARARCRRGGLRDLRVLHFATHGYSDDERSALVLSMVDGQAQAYLQDLDITRLTLQSDLVLPPAGDAGLGRRVTGEGVMRLPCACPAPSCWPATATR
jgi:hypothetical protein